MEKVLVSIKTARAVGAELAWRSLKPMVITGAVLAAALLVLGGWLTTLHPLWWILEFVFITSVMFFAILTGVITFILKRFTPVQSESQKESVHAFTDKLQRIADSVGISRFVLLFRIVRDILRPDEQTFIKQLASDSTTLHTDYLKLQKLFESDD